MEQITDHLAVRKFYSSYLGLYPKGGGWPSRVSATGVYKNAAASSIIPWRLINSVIDVGSGVGWFLQYLRKNQKYRGKYLGLELLGEQFEKSLETNVEDKAAVFIKKDFAEFRTPRSRFDWGFALGLLGTQQKNKAQYDRFLIKKMVTATRLGITISVLDKRVVSNERLTALPLLYAHNVDNVVAMVDECRRFARCEIVRDSAKNTSVSILFRSD